MGKTGRWRSEKNKIKALFVLHFHATGVAQVVGDSLLISLIPADVGKPTVRSDKAVIREGSCYWEKPIHESLRFFIEPRTGKFQEKIYYFVISNGWSKSDFVGEVSIDFASYAESFKVSSVSLPLKNAKCDAILHVSIQRVHEDGDEREIEEIKHGTTPSNDKISSTRLNNNSDANETIKGEYTCDSRSPLYHEIPVTEERKKNNRESCGSDLTISSSESSYGLDIPTKSEFKDNIVLQDPTSVLPTKELDLLPASTSYLFNTDESGAAASASPDDMAVVATSAAFDDVAIADRMVTKYELVPSSLPTTTGTTSATPDDVAPPDWSVANSFPEIVHEFYPTPQAELLSSSGPEASTYDSYEEKSEESSTLVIDELRAEVSTLSRKSEVAELELRTLRKLIVKETRKGQELLKEVVSLKDEKNALKEEYEKSKAKSKVEKGDPRALIGELRQELYYEKERNDNLKVQLMKMQESNSELILAIGELDELLEQKDNEIVNLSNNNEKEKIADVYNELETYKKDKEELEGHIEQLVLDYEILKQENHDLSYQLEESRVQEQMKLQYECSSSYAAISELQALVENLRKKLEKQSSKFSESLAVTAELEEYAKGLVDDLEKQAQAFEDDIEILTREKVELEKRAIAAEEALRKTRWQNANSAEKIHEEFRRLSVEMNSTLESNEMFTKNAIIKANELQMQKSLLEDLVNKSKEELHLLTIQYETKMNELSNQLSSKEKQIEQLEIEMERGEECKTTLSEEILMLRAEIETLKTENNSLSAEAEETERLKIELEQLNISMREMETVLERGKAEKDEREREIVHLQEEAQESVDELNRLRKAKDEKKIFIENLQCELERLQNQHDELKHLLSEDELEKDNLKNNIIVLEGQIKMKEAALETSTYSYLEKEKDLQSKIDVLERRLKDGQISATCIEKVDEDNDAVCLDGNACRVAHVTAENGDSERSSSNNFESSNELELLKERNKDMEYELKEMQERYSEISLKLAEVEGGRQQLMMRVRNLKNAKKS